LYWLTGFRLDGRRNVVHLKNTLRGARGIFSSIAAALSAVFLLASIAAWVRSYFICDQLIWTSQKPVMLGVAYGRGTIDFVRATFEPSIFVETDDSLALEKPKAGWELKHSKPDDRDTWGFVPPQHEMHLLGAKYRSGNVLFAYAQDLSLPMWILVLLFGILPTLWVFRRRRRRQPGRCPVCGYDMRATPQRCPECGTMPPANPVIV
jgi:hypothetical protein